MGVVHDRVPDRGVVHDGQQLGKMLCEQLEVQGLVLVVQLLQIDVLSHVGALVLQLSVSALRLLIERQHC